MQTINWYPGHMAKTKRMLEENLKLVDMVIEVTDARAPAACRNPDFETLFENKIRVIVLNKSDLSSREHNREWIKYYKENGMTAVEFVSVKPAMRKEAIALIDRAGAPIVQRYREKGINKTVRALVAGVPNVGKSTFINLLAGTAKAQVGNRPGVTRSKQWVKITEHLELMDTPGMLWGKLENETLAKHLAYIGSIRDEILDIEELSGLLLCDLMKICPAALTERYKKLTADMDSPEALLNGVCKSRGFMLSGGVYDTERAAKTVIDEFRAGKIARVAIEKPDDDFSIPAKNKNSKTQKQNTRISNEE